MFKTTDKRCASSKPWRPRWDVNIYEPWHDKTNKVAVRQAKTQISLGIRPVWSVFAVRMNKHWVLSYPLSAQRRLIRLGGCPGWSESSLGEHSFCLFCHVAAHMYMISIVSWYYSLLPFICQNVVLCWQKVRKQFSYAFQWSSQWLPLVVTSEITSF